MVADLWPEAAIQMGVLHNTLLIRLSEWLEWSTYQRAKLVWVVSEGVRDLFIQRGLSPERIFLLTNGVDTTLFHPFPQARARANSAGMIALLFSLMQEPMDLHMDWLPYLARLSKCSITLTYI